MQSADRSLKDGTKKHVSKKITSRPWGLGAGGSRPQVDRPRAWGKEYVAATSAVYLHPTDPHHADCLPALWRKCPRPLAFAAPCWAKGRNARFRVQGLRQPNEINRQRLDRRTIQARAAVHVEMNALIIGVCRSPHAQSGEYVRLGS
jgi:hypothetical protein